MECTSRGAALQNSIGIRFWSVLMDAESIRLDPAPLARPLLPGPSERVSARPGGLLVIFELHGCSLTVGSQVRIWHVSEVRHLK